MQIKEVQEKLKISSYTLRYYEKMGLIQPYRDENGYRNYSEEDIHKNRKNHVFKRYQCTNRRYQRYFR